MADSWTDVGLANLFNTGAISVVGSRLHLYQNNQAVAFGTLIGALTEATFTGYASINAIWPAGLGTTTAPGAFLNATAETFTMGVPGVTNNVYGWYMTNAGSTFLAAGGLFVGGPFAMTLNGQTITVTVQVTLLEA